MAALESDGSIRVTDPDGASRSLPVESVEVLRRGSRGARRWIPLTERIASSEQLGLF